MSAIAQKAPSRVVVLTGYGLRVAVERGHLIAEDGVGGDRRTIRLPRVGSNVERVIVIGHSGTVSLEALRWLYETGAAFVQIGADGELIATGAPHALSDVRLRRNQASAFGTRPGLEIARDLLLAKVQAQARVADRFEGERELRACLTECVERLLDAPTLDRLRFVESRAAAAYWSAWERIPVRFAGRDAKHVPAHWRTFGTRRSLLTASPRKATTPANALLNYLYAILEAEARLAALAVGCDPALGVIHVDSSSRDSLACDLMEPARPHVDLSVLELLQRETFTRSDFFETRDGNCRLMPELARPLARTALQWGRIVAPIAERVGGAFRHLRNEPEAHSARPRFRTPLTGANRSRREPHNSGMVAVPADDFPHRCRGCGADLGKRQRTYCDTCLPDAARRASSKAAAVQRDLRAIGADGRSSEIARGKHRTNAMRQAKERQAWEADQVAIPSRHVFEREIAPMMKRVPSEVLAEATGLSRQFCRKVKQGDATPHARHWNALRDAASSYLQAHGRDAEITSDPGFFARSIAPFLHALGARGIQNATRLSPSYSRRVLHGHHVPDAKHWPALSRAVESIRFGQQ